MKSFEDDIHNSGSPKSSGELYNTSPGNVECDRLHDEGEIVYKTRVLK